MVDITMCDNQDCHLRHRCYRAMAQASSYQSWAVFEPDGDECDFFVEIVRDARKAERAVEL